MKYLQVRITELEDPYARGDLLLDLGFKVINVKYSYIFEQIHLQILNSIDIVYEQNIHIFINFSI